MDIGLGSEWDISIFYCHQETQNLVPENNVTVVTVQFSVREITKLFCIFKKRFVLGIQIQKSMESNFIIVLLRSCFGH